MYERVGEEIKRRVRFLVIRRTLLTAILVIAAVAAVGSNNEDLVAPAIIAGIIVIIWVYSSARLQYLLLYGYGELIDKVSDLEARSQGGNIALRIEDLDDRCKRPELAAQLIDDLAWLGLEWDEGPYYQHDRLDLYEDALRQLQDAGLTYPCFCTRAELHAASAPHASDGTPIYRGACRNLSAEEVARRSALRAPATRLRVPAVDDLAGDVIEFVDRTYGAQCEALATECGDFLVRRSDGVFAYQLAVVVDDAAMGVTEVVRGCDLLGSTPRQIYLQHLLGLPTPHYAHIPLLMSPDGRRLSKRDRDLDLGELRARFGTPEALLGWLAGQTGIAPDTTPRSAKQLVEYFSWDVIRAHRENITVTAE